MERAQASSHRAIQYCRPRPGLNLNLRWLDKQVFDMEAMADYPLLFTTSSIHLKAVVTMQAEDVNDFLKQHP